ncbi:hypothetical protein BGW80DRAFT_1362622 [Lactifluus volemus]|nr:hypothetical protein BGW80DRAFT_1362622 [Lactifluus volemus]
MAAEQTESEVARVSEAETYRNTTQYKTKSEIAIRTGASSVYAQHDVTVGRLIVEHVVKPLALGATIITESILPALRVPHEPSRVTLFRGLDDSCQCQCDWILRGTTTDCTSEKTGFGRWDAGFSNLWIFLESRFPGGIWGNCDPYAAAADKRDENISTVNGARLV